ncbi:hypothetical protein [Halomonas sp. SCS19]|uniref:hypothetical protein n=1 Tax=Halomonas sp. SCS19 TaxID=2950870 RepID=UPI0032DEC9C5
MNKLNRHYEKIKDLGFDIELRSNRNGYNTIYVVDIYNKRVIDGVLFLHNKRDHKVDVLFSAREDTHKDAGLREALEKLNDFLQTENDTISSKTIKSESSELPTVSCWS